MNREYNSTKLAHARLGESNAQFRSKTALFLQYSEQAEYEEYIRNIQIQHGVGSSELQEFRDSWNNKYAKWPRKFKYAIGAVMWVGKGNSERLLWLRIFHLEKIIAFYPLFENCPNPFSWSPDKVISPYYVQFIEPHMNLIGEVGKNMYRSRLAFSGLKILSHGYYAYQGITINNDGEQVSVSEAAWAMVKGEHLELINCTGWLVTYGTLFHDFFSNGIYAAGQLTSFIPHSRTIMYTFDLACSLVPVWYDVIDHVDWGDDERAKFFFKYVVGLTVGWAIMIPGLPAILVWNAIQKKLFGENAGNIIHIDKKKLRSVLFCFTLWCCVLLNDLATHGLASVVQGVLGSVLSAAGPTGAILASFEYYWVEKGSSFIPAVLAVQRRARLEKQTHQQIERALQLGPLGFDPSKQRNQCYAAFFKPVEKNAAASGTPGATPALTA